MKMKFLVVSKKSNSRPLEKCFRVLKNRLQPPHGIVCCSLEALTIELLIFEKCTQILCSRSTEVSCSRGRGFKYHWVISMFSLTVSLS